MTSGLGDQPGSVGWSKFSTLPGRSSICWFLKNVWNLSTERKGDLNRKNWMNTNIFHSDSELVYDVYEHAAAGLCLLQLVWYLDLPLKSKCFRTPCSPWQTRRKKNGVVWLAKPQHLNGARSWGPPVKCFLVYIYVS